jgi:MoxR-like ATPase
MLAVRARALLDGRLAPSIDDVLDLAEPVLKHRMALTFSARAEGPAYGRAVLDRLALTIERSGEAMSGLPGSVPLPRHARSC